MKLSLEQIKEITTGAVRICEEEGLVRFHRFTEEQEVVYRERDVSFYNKCLCTAGVKFLFQTDSRRLGVCLKAEQGTSRSYFSMDIFCNDVWLDSLDNFDGQPSKVHSTDVSLPLGEFSKEFRLGEGVKTVCVHLPWSVITSIRWIDVDDQAWVKAVKPSRTLLVYGDSITQGADALRSCNRYTAKLAEYLKAEEYNKAVAGDGFFPELARIKDRMIPDYIVAAYGTNDWKKMNKETFRDKSKAFLNAIQSNYPLVPVFVITPIWRKDMDQLWPFGPFEDLEKELHKVSADLEGIHVVSGFDLVPHCEDYFADQRLHPNDHGFNVFFDRLWSKLCDVGIEEGEVNR